MNLKLVAVISALAAIPALAHAQQGGPQSSVSKPTKAEAQNVVQMITSDQVKTRAYCDLNKLEGEIKAADQKKDTKPLEALSKQGIIVSKTLKPLPQAATIRIVLFDRNSGNLGSLSLPVRP